MREPKPPRFNRYNIYLIVGLIIFAPLLASRGIGRACRFEHLMEPSVSCSGFDDWRWFLATGGNWEAWWWCALIALLIGALIWQSFH